MSVELITDRTLKLIEVAKRGGPRGCDAFGAVVLRDNDGQLLDLAPVHMLITNFIYDCWYPELRESIERRAEPPYYAGILLPWRHGKTLLGPIRTPLYELGLNPNKRCRLICGDDREAILRVSAARRFIESQEYKWIFPNVEPARHSDWTKHAFFIKRDSLGPDPSLSAAGIFNTEAGGGNDIVIFDDIATYQNMILRKALRPQVYDTMTSVWLRRIDPQTRVMFVGTTWHADDPAQTLMRQKTGQWRWLIVGVSDDFKRFDCRVEAA